MKAQCATHFGAPMLDAGPMQRWLRRVMADRQADTSQVAAMVGCDESRVRRLMRAPRVSELTVERFVLAVEADPRLAARLYAELDFSAEVFDAEDAEDA